MNDPLDFYARIGASLFPLGAGSKDPADPALVKSWKLDCSRDSEQWERWRAEHPDCNFGIVAAASGLIIIDIDTKADPQAWAMWCGFCRDKLGIEPIAPHVRSPSGGWHVYLRVPEGVNPWYLRQIDLVKSIVQTRIAGSTVVAGGYFAGDEKQAPGIYQLVDGAAEADLPTAPQALIDLLKRPERQITQAISRVNRYESTDVALLLDWMAAEKMFDDYDDWYKCLAALRGVPDDPGMELGRKVTWSDFPKAAVLNRSGKAFHPC